MFKVGSLLPGHTVSYSVRPSFLNQVCQYPVVSYAYIYAMLKAVLNHKDHSLPSSSGLLLNSVVNLMSIWNEFIYVAVDWVAVYIQCLSIMYIVHYVINKWNKEIKTNGRWSIPVLFSLLLYLQKDLTHYT